MNRLLYTAGKERLKTEVDQARLAGSRFHKQGADKAWLGQTQDK